MRNFTRAERSFIVWSVLTAILFLVIARLQFWGFESGLDVPYVGTWGTNLWVSTSTAIVWLAAAWIAFIAYAVTHRIVTTRAKVEAS